MPPVVVAVIAAAAPAIATALGASAVLTAVISIAVAIVGQLLMIRPKPKQGTELRLELDPNVPRGVATGFCATSGSVVWAFTYTDDFEKPNRYLYRVISLSDYPIEDVPLIREGKDYLTFDGDPTTDWVQCNQHKSKKGATRMWMRIYLGSFAPTADAQLITASGGLWTANHKGVGQAYAIVKYDYDTDAFPNGEPSLVYVMRGARVYDDRKDPSKGGVGTQALDTPASWQYSENAANIIAQVLRGFKINNQLIVGVGAEERDLPFDMLVAAYNTCDEMVESNDPEDDDEIPRYRAGYMVKADEEINTALGDLSIAMDGRIYDRGGQITIMPGATHTPVYHITDQDIIWTEEKSWQPKAADDALYNYVNGSFVSWKDGFLDIPYPPRSNSQWEEDDGNERFVYDLDMKAVPFESQAQRTSKRFHEASRWQGLVGFIGPLWLLEAEQGDWFTMTSERFGFEDKYFQIEFITIIPDAMKVAIVGKEVSPTIDGWNAAVDEKPRTDTTWTPPGYEPPIPTLFVSPYSEVGANGIEIPGLIVTIAGIPQDGVIQYVELELAYADDLETSWDGPQVPANKRQTIISGLSKDTDYAVRGRSFDGVQHSEWSDWVTDTTPDYTILYGNGDPLDTTQGATIGAPTGTIVHDRVAEAVVADLDIHSEGYFHQVLTFAGLKEYTDALTYLDGVPVGTVIRTYQNQTTDGLNAAAEIFTLLGAKSSDNTAFVLNASSVRVSPTQSLAQWMASVSAEGSDGSAAVTLLMDAVFGTSGGLAKAVLTLDVNGNVAGFSATNDGNTSAFYIIAEQFGFVATDGDLPFRPFYYDDGKIYMDEVYIKKLDVGVVTTDNIALGQVTDDTYWAANYGSGAAGNTLGTASSDTWASFGLTGDKAEVHPGSTGFVKAGANVTVRMYVNLQRTGGDNDRVWFRLRRSGIATSTSYIGDVVKAGMGNYPIVVSYEWADEISTDDTYTYALEYYKDEGEGTYYSAKLICSLGKR